MPDFEILCSGAVSFVIVLTHENKISSKSNYISPKYGDITIFNMAVVTVVRHFEFSV